jgi:hypothetical protein
MSFFTFKKLGRSVLLSAAVVVSAASGVSALDLGWGFGGMYTGDFTGLWGLKGNLPVTNGITTGSADFESKVPWSGGGLNLFFDAQYAELSLGLFGGIATRDESARFMGVSLAGRTEEMGFVGFDVGVLGKFPVALGEKIRAFPLAGISYTVPIVQPEDGALWDLNSMWIKFGAGADFDLSETWFFRPEFLYGFRLKNKYEKDQIAIPNYNLEAISGKGLTVKVGLGMKI